MIIPKHRECDICQEEIPLYNKRSYKIQSKVNWVSSAGACRDHIDIDLCEDCWREMRLYIRDNVDEKRELEKVKHE